MEFLAVAVSCLVLISATGHFLRWRETKLHRRDVARGYERSRLALEDLRKLVDPALKEKV